MSDITGEAQIRVEAEAASDRELNRLGVTLHHQHLPKMASAGLLECDEESRTVEATQAILT